MLQKRCNMNKELPEGLYEQIINTSYQEALSEEDPELVKSEKLGDAESSDSLAQYVGSLLKKALAETEDVPKRVELSNQIISILSKVDSDLSAATITTDEQNLLTEILTKVPQIKKTISLPRPNTSLVHSTLFTGSTDISMVAELKKEFESADRVDMLVSFIKVSGLSMIREALKAFTGRGGKLRVITTTYMGATDVAAIQELSMLPHTMIHISYDTKHTRLHAKAYMFYRETGFDTAYVGSSNLSNAAITDGREWNVKLTVHDQPDVFQQMQASFDVYWHSDEFLPYQVDDFEKLKNALDAEKYHGEAPIQQSYFFDIKPFPFQQAILDRLQAERSIRQQDHHRNLIVAATGTGKTVISAFDYRNFRDQHRGQANRLLFIAHREEILQQSLACFRGVLHDRDFGELFVGRHTPEQTNYLFISIQTIDHNKALWKQVDPSFYDFIVVDEFHHAVAPSYQLVLSHFTPQILLGLTATPERLDGLDILKYFDGHKMTAEIRLPEAINRQLLVPFHYYGIADGTDLKSLHWTRGGYEVKDLENLYIASHAAEKRAQLIINSLPRYIGDLREIKGIGFCVSVPHAEFMANFFSSNGLPSIALSSHSTEEERVSAKERLESGQIRFIFVVDLYNEGVDIPAINTILFLRPTASLTVFLQQLGRGLRTCKGKEFLTVLDFIGQANQKYNFEEKFRALLDKTRHSVTTEISAGFVSVPKGCYIELEKQAQEDILSNIRATLGRRQGVIQKLIDCHSFYRQKPTISQFLAYSHMSPFDVYRWDSFSRLCVDAGILEDFQESLDPIMQGALYRLAHMDSRRAIFYFQNLLKPDTTAPDWDSCTSEEKSLLWMLLFTIWQDAAETDNPIDKIKELKNNPTYCREIKELLAYKLDTIDIIDKPYSLNKVKVLDIHATYSRDQLFAALGFLKPNTVREGVKWLPDQNCDVFLVTLDKSDKDFSPTTLYDDYAIDPNTFHWQSQSTTSDHSPTGQRYIHHRQQGSKVLLFVREAKKDSNGYSQSYTFLGEVSYISHTGSKPMSINWHLEEPIPAKFMRKLSKSLIG